MQALLYANLTTKALSSSLTGGAFSFPKLTAGDDLSLKLRLCQQFDGANVETKRTLNSLRASIGHVDAAPRSGSFTLYAGEVKSASNTTASIAFDATAQQIEDAVNALTDTGLAAVLPCTVVDESGVKVLRWREGAEMALEVAGNQLHPRAFVQIRPVNWTGNEWRYNIALIQAPGASTSGHQLVLTEPPSIVPVRSGTMNGDIAVNEIQKLIVPSDYRGQYEIRRGFRKTIALNEQDDAASVTTALEALADDGGVFVTNNVATGELLIEFTGTMGGADQELLTVHLLAAAPHDIAFTLSTQTDEMMKLLRAYRDRNTQETKLILEIELRLQDEHDDEVERVVTFRTDVLFTGEVNWPGLDAMPMINWLRPPFPERLWPYDWTQTANGQQHYSVECKGSVPWGQPGYIDFDHAAVIDHGLGSRVVCVVVRQNQDQGPLLTQGVDYTVTVTNDNAVRVVFLGVWASGTFPLLVTVVAFAQVEQFNPHTHEIDEVTGLRAELDALAERVAALEDAMPGTGVGSTVTASAGTTLLEVPLPSIFELYPSRVQIDSTSITRVIDVPLSALGRDGALLPATHDKTITNLSAVLSYGVLPEVLAPYKGKVIKNNTGIVHFAPGGGQRKGFKVWPDEHITTDGRYWFKVVKEDQDTWYPAEMERELCVISVNGNMLPVGRTLEMRLGFEVAILTRKAITLFEREYERTRESAVARWKFVIELGYLQAQSGTITPSGDTAVATVGGNISAITWEPTPLVQQVINVSRLPQVHTMGLKLKRIADTTFVGTALRYAQSSNAGTVPTDSTFALRARLTQFDLNESDVVNPLGVVALMGLNRGLLGAADDTLGKITIK